MFHVVKSAFFSVIFEEGRTLKFSKPQKREIPVFEKPLKKFRNKSTHTLNIYLIRIRKPTKRHFLVSVYIF